MKYFKPDDILYQRRGKEKGSKKDLMEDDGTMINIKTTPHILQIKKNLNQMRGETRKEQNTHKKKVKLQEQQGLSCPFSSFYSGFDTRRETQVMHRYRNLWPPFPQG